MSCCEQVMNFRVTRNAVNFSTGWGTVSFVTRNLLHGVGWDAPNIPMRALKLLDVWVAPFHSVWSHGLAALQHAVPVHVLPFLRGQYECFPLKIIKHFGTRLPVSWAWVGVPLTATWPNVNQTHSEQVQRMWAGGTWQGGCSGHREIWRAVWLTC